VCVRDAVKTRRR